MNSLPIVSVIIPTYNAASTIEESINSVFNQSYSNIEIIVIDDGSTDNTEALLTQYSSRITYIKKENGGFASARNAGTKIAKGEYIAWLDADDIFRDNKIAKQIEFLKNNPEIHAVSSEFSAFDENGTINSHYMRTYYPSLGLVDGSLSKLLSIANSGIKSYKGNLFDHLLLGNFLHPPTLVFRRELIDKAGPQREDLGSATDYEYILRLSLLSPLALLDEVLLDYRLSDFQDSSPVNALKNWPETIECLKRLLDWESVKNTEREVVIAKRIRNLFISLALEQAFESPSNAITSIKESMKYGPLGLDSVLALLKAIVPKFIIAFKRKLISPYR